MQINLSFGFSRAVGSASDTSNDKVLYQPKHYGNLISGKKVVKKKRQRPEAPTCIAEFLYVTVLSTSWLENINPTPFQDTRQSLRVRNTPVL